MMLPSLRFHQKQQRQTWLSQGCRVPLGACLLITFVLSSGVIVLARLSTPLEMLPSTGVSMSTERMLRGNRVYRKACQMCHGESGLGQSVVGPALLESIWLRTCRPEQISAAVLHGIMGPLPGVQSAHPIMPGFGFWLSDQDVADVAGYTVRIWGRRFIGVTPEKVAEVRAQHAGRQIPWTLDELEKHYPAHPSKPLVSTP